MNEPRTPTIRQIKERVAEFYGVTVHAIDGGRRTAKIVRPRHVVCWLSCELTKKSLPAIGRQLGDRDHTTILHGQRTITKALKTDEALKAEVEFLADEIRFMCPEPENIHEAYKSLEEELAREKAERAKISAELETERREKSKLLIRKAAAKRKYQRTMSYAEEERIALERYAKRAGGVVHMIGDMPPPGRSALDMKLAEEVA